MFWRNERLYLPYVLLGCPNDDAPDKPVYWVLALILKKCVSTADYWKTRYSIRQDGFDCLLFEVVTGLLDFGLVDFRVEPTTGEDEGTRMRYISNSMLSSRSFRIRVTTGKNHQSASSLTLLKVLATAADGVLVMQR